MQTENFTLEIKHIFNRILIKDAETFYVGN